MTRSFIRQNAQIRQSVTYDDTVAPTLANFETNPVNVEQDLNNLRSAHQTLMGQTNWFDTPTRDVETIQAALNAAEVKPFLFRTQVLTDVTVTAAQNFEVLSVAGVETPSQTAAVGAVNTEGAVVAFHSGAFGTHSLDEVVGPSALRPDSLLEIRDAVTGEFIVSSNGKNIYGLLQSEVAADGHTFNDTTQQVQISFVEENAAGTDLIATAAADIAGATINYMYAQRLQFQNLTEDVFLSGVFVDRVAVTDVTLDRAIDNQVGNATQSANRVWQLLTGVSLDFNDNTDAPLLSLDEDSAGDSSVVRVGAAADLFDVDAVLNDFLNGASFDTGAPGTTIGVGVTPNQIDSGGALRVASGGGADLTLAAALELFLDDANQAGSSWAQTTGVKLTESTAEWSLYETNFGEVSIFNALNQAAGGENMTRAQAVVQSNVAADTDVSGPTGASNLDVDLLDYSALVFVDDTMIFLNGQLLRNGADAAANEDVYPGTTPAIGELRFEFSLQGTGGNPDVITMLTFS